MYHLKRANYRENDYETDHFYKNTQKRDIRHLIALLFVKIPQNTTFFIRHLKRVVIRTGKKIIFC